MKDGRATYPRMNILLVLLCKEGWSKNLRAFSSSTQSRNKSSGRLPLWEWSGGCIFFLCPLQFCDHLTHFTFVLWSKKGNILDWKEMRHFKRIEASNLTFQVFLPLPVIHPMSSFKQTLQFFSLEQGIKTGLLCSGFSPLLSFCFGPM